MREPLVNSPSIKVESNINSHILSSIKEESKKEFVYQTRQEMESIDDIWDKA